MPASQSLAKTVATPPVLTDQDRRRHKRITMSLKSRYLDASGVEHAARTLNISPGGALFASDAPVDMGQRIIAYIDELGRFEGDVKRVCEGAFAIKFRARQAQICRTADKLTWIANRHRAPDVDLRSAPRRPFDETARLVLEDGAVEPCRIVDMSLTGASVEIAAAPRIGTQVVLGKMRARVVRQHETGVAVEFLGPCVETAVSAAATRH